MPGDQHVDDRPGDRAAPVAALAEQVGRLADRLRSLSDARLRAAHRVAQQLADAAARLAGEPVRPVPRLDDLVVGDQVAVTGADLLAALDRAARDDPDGPWRAAAESALSAVRTLRDQV